MVGLASVVLLAAPLLAPPIPWASGFSPEGSWGYVGDVDGDGYADLVRVQPRGDAFIDVSLSVNGLKAGRPERAQSNWGKDCEASAVGVFAGETRATVVGLFDQMNLRLATFNAGGKATDVPLWLKLPSKVAHGRVAVVAGTVVIWNSLTGKGYQVDTHKHSPTDLALPKGVVSVQDLKIESAHWWVIERHNGMVELLDPSSKTGLLSIGQDRRGQNAVVAGDKVFVDVPRAGAPVNVQARPTSTLPLANSIWASGDVDNDGDQDLIQFRFGSEPHTGNDVMLYRMITPGEVDSDHDGLSNDEEIRLGTDPYNPDTDGDGLIDGWEVNGFRGLDLKALGCNPRHVDLVCLISRYEDVDEKFAKDTFAKVGKYYDALPTKNPDGVSGWHLHPVFLDKVSGDDMKNPWWANRDKFLPSKWKGVVHWMQIGRGGGGQADELGDGGGCGGGGMALYATFIHEFGHQLGLSHNGFFSADGCPVYPSLMNYPYSYTLNGDIHNIGYSDGRLANVVIKETDLDEELPLPIEKIKFLASAPYFYHLKANGKTTLIDWNWNGVFGEHHVRADINYAYSTTAGRRDDFDKTETAPWILSHHGRAYVLFGRDSLPANPSRDPTLGPSKPGALYMKRLKKPFEWDAPQMIEYWGLIGDPVAASFEGKIVAAYQTKSGVIVRDIEDEGANVNVSKAEVVEPNPEWIPALGVFDHRLWLFLWNPKSQEIRYRVLRGGQSGFQTLPEKSTCPVGLCDDTIRHQLIVGMAQDQAGGTQSHWQIQRFRLKGDSFVGESVDWVHGVKGDAHGRSRPVVLFDKDKRHGPNGKVYYFTLGAHGTQYPWACGYVAETVDEKKISGGHVQNGWIVKRFYDEWSQSRSTVGAAFFKGDILYAYRWIDGGQGPTDNNLHLGYHGTGIEDGTMGDFDDLSFMLDFGIRHSILYLNRG